MQTLSYEEGIIYEFNKENPYTKKVESGTTLTIETYDCFQNQIKSQDTEVTAIDWNKINPATGPVYVEGAMPGDVLKVKIEEIEIGEQGVMVVGPDLGVMGHRIENMESKILPIHNHKVMFNGLEIPVNKMIGVIGVAPAGEGVNCGTPGAHGGNMDNKMVAEGATLYFPVFVEGALFSLGDFHAAMGDGEVSVTGVEVPGAATVTLEVVKGETLEHPMLENKEVFTQIVSAETLDEAAKLATSEMIERIVAKSSMSISEATMLMSAVGQTEICQIVDPLMTARFVVPKWVLQQLDIQLF
ncbi:acetamidase/formamidase family protein [Sporosarcina pasteurii]|uniref:Formamidase n=1 Tax=Sporosarcina pasteurii TaxID=1474 RepID=A0A380BEA4_SPOPA|nr:acetamidase/formamidase family protein [Sporosarcina pasteurii]MDS9472381.1 acetamidase/formamidase family protein [Sporosarcina pasteurii]QBQ06358.1 acetamidase [Sporosarcina pasteurii]SUI98899.1 Formamidase [Sporosarcina pasteurii]